MVPNSVTICATCVLAWWTVEARRVSYPLSHVSVHALTVVLAVLGSTSVPVETAVVTESSQVCASVSRPKCRACSRPAASRYRARHWPSARRLTLATTAALLRRSPPEVLGEVTGRDPQGSGRGDRRPQLVLRSPELHLALVDVGLADELFQVGVEGVGEPVPTDLTGATSLLHPPHEASQLPHPGPIPEDLSSKVLHTAGTPAPTTAKEAIKPRTS